MPAVTFEPQIPIACITDEFSPSLTEAIPAMKEIGMIGAELRVIDGKNILDLSDSELARTKNALEEAELKVISIASPLLKCVLPNAPDVDQRFGHDAFASRGQDYHKLIVELKRLAAKRVLQSQWVLYSDLSCSALRDDLKCFLDTNDRLVVIEVSTWATTNAMFSIRELKQPTTA